jgi:hypothetical protein
MQRLPQEDLREALTILGTYNGIDNQTALRLKQKLAEHFRQQLMMGAPTNEDEAGLRRLAAQIKAQKVVVKLFLRHPLHAKLYLLFRPDPINPTIGYLGKGTTSRPANRNRSQDHGGSFTGWQTTHGFLPHQLVQTPGKQWAGVHPVY